MRESHTTHDDFIRVDSVQHASMSQILTAYQQDAVQWMLHRENGTDQFPSEFVKLKSCWPSQQRNPYFGQKIVLDQTVWKRCPWFYWIAARATKSAWKRSLLKWKKPRKTTIAIHQLNAKRTRTPNWNAFVCRPQAEIPLLSVVQADDKHICPECCQFRTATFIVQTWVIWNGSMKDGSRC